MLRLAKVLNSNFQYEVIKLNNKNLTPFAHGCALVCKDGVAVLATDTEMPEYIAIVGEEEEPCATVNAMLVTDAMVFKTEYVGDTAPYVGMCVGLAKNTCEMDAVTHNENGKGTVLAVDSANKLVYVRFRR